MNYNLHNRLKVELGRMNEIVYHSKKEHPKIIVELQILVAKCCKIRKI